MYEDEILDALATVYSTSKYNDNVEVMVRKQAKDKEKQEAERDIMTRNNGQEEGDSE